jgi:hypothetical protein
MGMWPSFRKDPMGWNYRGHAVFLQEQEDAYAKQVGAFYAYRRVGDTLAKSRARLLRSTDLAGRITLFRSALVPGELEDGA